MHRAALAAYRRVSSSEHAEAAAMVAVAGVALGTLLSSAHSEPIISTPASTAAYPPTHTHTHIHFPSVAQAIDRGEVVIIDDILTHKELQNAQTDVSLLAEKGKFLPNANKDRGIRRDSVVWVTGKEQDLGPGLTHAVALLRGLAHEFSHTHTYKEKKSVLWVQSAAQLACYSGGGGGGGGGEVDTHTHTHTHGGEGGADGRDGGVVVRLGGGEGGEGKGNKEGGEERKGEYYAPHLDASVDSVWTLGLSAWLRARAYRERVITAILYLNDQEWDPALLGGCLRCYPPDTDTHTHTHLTTTSSQKANVTKAHTHTSTPREIDTHTHTHTSTPQDNPPHPNEADTHTHTHTHQDVAPCGGRLVLFDSRLILHEVLPSHLQGGKRIALTVWVSDRQDR